MLDEKQLLQVGVGGILAVQVIRVVLDGVPKLLTAAKRGGNFIQTTGEKDPAFWQMEIRQAMREEVSTTILPILAQQTRILEKLAERDVCCKHCPD